MPPFFSSANLSELLVKGKEFGQSAIAVSSEAEYFYQLSRGQAPLLDIFKTASLQRLIGAENAEAGYELFDSSRIVWVSVNQLIGQETIHLNWLPMPVSQVASYQTVQKSGAAAKEFKSSAGDVYSSSPLLQETATLAVVTFQSVDSLFSNVLDFYRSPVVAFHSTIPIAALKLNGVIYRLWAGASPSHAPIDKVVINMERFKNSANHLMQLLVQHFQQAQRLFGDPISNLSFPTPERQQLGWQQHLGPLLKLSDASYNMGRVVTQGVTKRLLFQRLNSSTYSLKIMADLKWHHHIMPQRLITPFDGYLNTLISVQTSPYVKWGLTALEGADAAFKAVELANVIRHNGKMLQAPLNTLQDIALKLFVSNEPWPNSSLRARHMSYKLLVRELLGQGSMPSYFEQQVQNICYNLLLQAGVEGGQLAGRFLFDKLYWLYAKSYASLVSKYEVYDYYPGLTSSLGVIEEIENDTGNHALRFLFNRLIFEKVLTPVFGIVGAGVSTGLVRKKLDERINHPNFIFQLRRLVKNVIKNSLFNLDEIATFPNLDPLLSRESQQIRSIPTNFEDTCVNLLELMCTKLTVPSFSWPKSSQSEKTKDWRHSFVSIVRLPRTCITFAGLTIKGGNDFLQQPKGQYAMGGNTIGNERKLADMVFKVMNKATPHNRWVYSAHKLGRSPSEKIMLPVSWVASQMLPWFFSEIAALRQQIDAASSLETLPLREDLVALENQARRRWCCSARERGKVQRLARQWQDKREQLEAAQVQLETELPELQSTYQMLCERISGSKHVMALPSDSELEMFQHRISQLAANTNPLSDANEATTLFSNLAQNLLGQQQQAKEQFYAQMLLTNMAPMFMAATQSVSKEDLVNLFSQGAVPAVFNAQLEQELAALADELTATLGSYKEAFLEMVDLQFTLDETQLHKLCDKGKCEHVKARLKTFQRMSSTLVENDALFKHIKNYFKQSVHQQLQHLNDWQDGIVEIEKKLWSIKALASNTSTLISKKEYDMQYRQLHQLFKALSPAKKQLLVSVISMSLLEIDNAWVTPQTVLQQYQQRVDRNVVSGFKQALIAQKEQLRAQLEDDIRAGKVQTLQAIRRAYQNLELEYEQFMAAYSQEASIHELLTRHFQTYHPNIESDCLVVQRAYDARPEVGRSLQPLLDIEASCRAANTINSNGWGDMTRNALATVIGERVERRVELPRWLDIQQRIGAFGKTLAELWPTHRSQCVQVVSQQLNRTFEAGVSRQANQQAVAAYVLSALGTKLRAFFSAYRRPLEVDATAELNKNPWQGNIADLVISKRKLLEQQFNAYAEPFPQLDNFDLNASLDEFAGTLTRTLRDVQQEAVQQCIESTVDKLSERIGIQASSSLLFWSKQPLTREECVQTRNALLQKTQRCDEVNQAPLGDYLQASFARLEDRLEVIPAIAAVSAAPTT